MELVIRVNLDEAKQSLPEVFGIIGDCLGSDEMKEAAVAGAAGVIKDTESQVIGEWEIEEAENAPNPLESSYRALAAERYARRKEIEVDRFATVSPADDGAYVQGWLFVPRADVVSSGQEPPIARKGPQSVTRIENAKTKAS